MTLGQNYFTERNETWRHYALKMIVYKMLRNMGREVYIECSVGLGIADVFDRTTGVVYEIQANMNDNILKKKAEQYMRSAFCNDVKIIPLGKFPNFQFGRVREKLADFVA